MRKEIRVPDQEWERFEAAHAQTYSQHHLKLSAWIRAIIHNHCDEIEDERKVANP